MMARLTGLEPATSGVTGRHSNRLSYARASACLERAKGFEPSTPTLARLCSTPELHPRSAMPWHRCEARDVPQNAAHCKGACRSFRASP